MIDIAGRLLEINSELETEITRLREENARLRAALRPLIEIEDYPDAVLMKRIRAAAAAIREGGER